MNPDRPTRVAVGRVVRAHGVRGEVGINPHTEVEDRFAPGAVLSLEDGRSLTVKAIRRHRGRPLLAFEGVEDRDAAERLRGAYLFVPVEALSPLPEGSFWPHELEGCEVVTTDGRSLGVLAEVLRGPANDVWVARGDEGDTLIPALKDVVASVDLDGRRIEVREDGLP